MKLISLSWQGASDMLFDVRFVSQVGRAAARCTVDRDPFEREYVKDPGPSEQYRRYAWRTAIGLQAVDGLETSEYLAQIAERNIAGEISFEEVSCHGKGRYRFRR